MDVLCKLPWRRHRRAPAPPDFADVSGHQPHVDWNAYAASGRKMAVCKATEGSDWNDPTMASNRQALGDLGLYCGLYHFAGASGSKTIGDPTTEANHFLEQVGPLGPREFPVLDFELPDGLTAAQQADWVKTWCETVEQKSGKTPWIYTSAHMANTWDASQLTRYPLWVARYVNNPDPQQPPATPWPNVVAWQYTENATVAGIGTSDDSWLYGSLKQATHRHHHRGLVEMLGPLVERHQRESR